MRPFVVMSNYGVCLISSSIVLDQYHALDFYSVSSLKQQLLGRHMAPLGHLNIMPC
jgi:hypothetical protein